MRNNPLATLFESARVRKDGTRRLAVKKTIPDRVSKALADTKTPTELLRLCSKFGIKKDEVMDRAKAAPNFGQLRMVLGNRIRGNMRHGEDRS
jgi:hypothetical protein